MRDIQKDQKQFMEKCNQVFPKNKEEIGNFNNSDCELWRTLIREEYCELMTALVGKDLILTADACVDLIYVIMGLLNNLGLPFEKLWEEIHNSNMSKLVGGVKKREDGKLLKSSTYLPPDIEKVLKTFSEDFLKL